MTNLVQCIDLLAEAVSIKASPGLPCNHLHTAMPVATGRGEREEEGEEGREGEREGGRGRESTGKRGWLYGYSEFL